MRPAPRLLQTALAAIIVALSGAGCDEPTRKRLGETCSADSECASGLCSDNRCLDPEADEDSDGLINRLEVQLGSDPLRADSDLDGIDDGAELTPGRDIVDTDGDLIADIIESRTADADDDCIPDQFDAQNNAPSADLSPMRDIVCRLEGVCDSQRDLLTVACPADVAVCVYDAIVGFSDPEASCDGIDQSCDGVADEDFPDLDEDDVADCVDSDADGDQVTDLRDNCPGLANPTQADAQQDGVGDACEAGKQLVFSAVPPSVDAGTPFVVTVTLQDAAGTVVTSFTGIVSLSLAGESGGLVSASAAAEAGVATLDGVIGTRAGVDWTLVATSGPYEITYAGFDIEPGPVAELDVSLGPTAEDAVLAGVDSDAVVQAFDLYGNLVTDFDGTVTLQSDDVQAELPAAYTFAPADLGSHTFEGLVFKSAGAHSVTASTTGATGTATFEVLHGPAAAVDFEGAPASIIAGDAIDLAFVIVDAFDNVVRDFSGVVTLMSDDPQATLAGPVTLAASDLGRGHFPGVRLTRPGTTVLTASFTGGSGQASIVVGTGLVTGLRIVSAPATVVAGSAFSFTVEAIDQSGNVETSYGGTVGLTVDDAGATLPASVTLAGGKKVVSGVVLELAGVRTIELRDASLDLSTSGLVTVTPGPATTLSLGALPSNITAGVPQVVSLTVLDAYGNVADFDQPVDLSADDPNVHFATDPITVVDGVGSITVTFEQSGEQSLTVTAGALSVSATTTVLAGPQVAVRVLDLPASVVAGAAHTLRAEAVDSFGNRVTTVSGPAAVSSTDPGYVGPTTVSLVAGQASFEVRLVTAGARRVGVTHTTGVGFAETNVTPAPFAGIKVLGLPPTVVAGESRVVELRAVDAYDNLVPENGQVDITSSDPLYDGPSEVVLVAGANTLAFELGTVGPQTVLAKRGLIEGSAQTTVAPASVATLALDGLPATLVAGSEATVTVQALDDFGNRVTSFTASATVATDDPEAEPIAPITFVAGVASFDVTLVTAGTRNVVVTSGAYETSASTNVTAGAAVRFAILDLPTSVVAGVQHTITAVALDAFDNVATSYGSVPVTITSDDPAFEGPGVVMFGGGTSTFSVTFNTSGTRAVTASRLGLTGSATTSVAPANLASVSIEGLPAGMVAGQSAVVTVRVLDALGQTIEAYDGAGTIDSSDAQATFVLDPLAFDGGVASVTVTMKTAGSHTVSVTVGGLSDDAATIVSASTYVDLRLLNLPATTVAGATHDLQVIAVDGFDNLVASVTGSVAITSTDPAYEGPTSVLLSGGQATFQARLKTAGTRAIAVAHGGFDDTRAANVTPGTAAALAITGLPPSVVAGASTALTITAQDPFGNTVPSVSGGGTIGSTDASFAPATLTFSGGVATTSVTFTKVGTKSVTASSGALGDTETTTVTPAAYADINLVGVPATVVAGADIVLQAVAVDAFDNVVSTQSGNVTITSDDPLYQGPTTQAYVSGVASFTARLRTAGTRQLTVAHSGFSDSKTTDVTTAPATVLALTGLPSTMVAGASATLTITARDAFGNTATSVTGPGTISAPDASFVPSALTFTGGVATTSVSFSKVGNKSVTAQVSGLTDVETTTVGPAAYADIKLVGMPVSTVAGADIVLQAVAVDAFDNVVTTQTGSVTITSDDAQYQGPATQPYVGGVAAFTAKLKTVGTRRITVVHGGFDDLKTTSVTLAPMASIELTGLPANMTAGNSAPLTITAKDAFGNTVTTLGGAGTIGAPDATFVPSTLSFTSGVATTQVTFSKVGSKIVAASANGFDDAEPTTVGPGAYADVKITGLPVTTAAGTSLSLAVNAVDAFDNIVPSVTGSASITSSDPAYTGPGSVTFASGVGAFTGKLQSAGAQTITARHNAFEDIAATTVTLGSVDTIVLTGLPATMVAGVSAPLTVTAKDSFGNTVTTFTGGGTIGAPDATFVPATLSFVNGVATTSVSFSKVGSKSVTASASGFQDIESTTVGPAAYADIKLLNMPVSTVAGADIGLQAVAVDAFDNVVTTQAGTVTITSDDPQYQGPATQPYVNGVAGFTAKLETVGARRITVAHGGFDDNKTTSVTVAATAAVELTGLPASSTAGAAVSLTITAKDAFGNTATTFNGPGTIGAPDATFVPPALSFASGVATTSVTFSKVGSKTVTASASGFDDAENTTVGPGPYADVKLLNMPATTVAGADIGLQAVAVDAFDNVVTTQTGAVTITSDDPQYQGPVTQPYASGVAAFTARLKTVGTKRITVSHGGFNDLQTTNVTAAAPASIELTGVPANSTAGVAAPLTVTAKDGFGNTVTTFSGVGTIAAPDATFLPTGLTFTSGVATTSVTFSKVGSKTVTASASGFDDAESTTVGPGPYADIKLLNMPAMTVAGADILLQAVAVDAFDNVVTTQTGAVTITSDDPQYQGPATQAYVNGNAGFTAKLKTAGTQRITVAHGAFDDFETTNVMLAPMSGIVITGLPANIVAGNTASLTITARDTFGNTITTFGGTGTIGAPDATFVPTSLSFTSGVATTSVSFTKVGTKNVNASANGFNDSKSTTVGHGSYADVKLVGLPPNIQAGAQSMLDAVAVDAFDNVVMTQTGTVTITSDDPQYTGPSSANYVNGTATFNATLKSSGLRTITVAHGTFDGSQQTNVNTGPLGKFLLDGLTPSVTAGDLPTLTVTAADQYGNPLTAFNNTADVDFNDPDGFVSEDPLAFTAGVASIDVQFIRAGTRMLAFSSGPVRSEFFTDVGAADYTTLRVLGLPPMVTAGASPVLTLLAVDDYDNVVDMTVEATWQVSGSEADPTPVTLTQGSATVQPTLILAGTRVVRVDDGPIHGEAQTNVKAGPGAELRTFSQVTDVDPGVPVAMKLSVTDTYGNLAKDWVGSVAATSPTSATINSLPTPTSVQITAADQGSRDLMIAFFTPGLQHIDFAATGLSGTTFHLGINGTPEVVEVRVTAIESFLYSHAELSFRVELLDETEQPFVAPQDVPVQLRLGQSFPGPANLTGTLDGVILAGQSQVVFDEVTLDRGGRFSLEADTTPYGVGPSVVFQVHDATPNVVIDNATQVGGCVYIDYTIIAPVTQRSDVEISIAPPGSSQFQRGTQGAVQDAADAEGGERLRPGSHRFVWDARRDLGPVDGSASFSILAYPGAPAAASNPGQSNGSGVEVELGAGFSFTTRNLNAAASDIAAGDFDGDGASDNIIALPGGLYFDLAQLGAFVGDEPASLPRRVTLGNTDFQGGDELIVLDPDQGMFRVYYYQETVGDIDPVDVPVCSGGIATDVAVVDGYFDYRDVVVTCDTFSQGKVERWRYEGQWTLLAASELGWPARAIAVGDLDLDGVDELVVGGDGGVRIITLLPQTFATVQDFAVPTGVQSLSVGDLDRDAAGDVVAASQDGRVMRFRGLLSGALLLDENAVMVAAPDAAFAVQVADLDRDENLDIAIASSSVERLVILGGDGDGNFAQRRFDNSPQGSGRMDLSLEGRLVYAIENNAQRTWGKAVETVAPHCSSDNDTFMVTPPRLEGAAFVRSADVDGDGRVDLLAANEGEDSISVALGRGDGGFFGSLVPVGSGGALDVAVGDIDGDGRPDLAIRYAQEVQLLRNIGGPGAPEYELMANIDVAAGSVLAVDDLDGDWRADIVFTDVDGLVSIAYVDDDFIDTHELTIVTTIIASPEQLVVGSLDDRGDLDLLYVTRFFVDYGNGDELSVVLCRAFADAYEHRLYSGGGDCAPIGAGLSQAELEALVVDDLALELSVSSFGRALYRVSGDTGAPFIQSRIVRSDDGIGDAATLQVCSEGVRAFGVGDFDPLTTEHYSDFYQDVGAVCQGDDGDYLGLGLRALNDDVAETGDISATLGADAITIADFDSNGLSDFATAHGALPLYPAAPLVIDLKAPAPKVAPVPDEQPKDVRIADVTGDTIADIITLTVERNQSGANQGTFVHLAVMSPFASGVLDDRLTITLCAGNDCPQGEAQMAIGDLTNDGRADVLLSFQLDGQPGLHLYSVDRDASIVPVPFSIDTLDPLPFHPDVLLIGDVFPDERGNPDVVIAGSGKVRVAEQPGFWQPGLNIVPVYLEMDGSQVPQDVQAAFIGDFELVDTTGNELALLSRGDQRVWLVSPGCSVETPDCISLVDSFPVFDGMGDSYVIEGITAGVMEPTNLDGFVVSVVQSVGDGKRQVVEQLWHSQSSPEWISQRLGEREYGADYVVERNFGPFLGDVDDDGRNDIIVGWKDGRSWLVYPAFDFAEPYVYGGFAEGYGAAAAFGDVDGNGRQDVLLFDEQLWVVNQGKLPLPPE